jgi:UDP:flavonoid glycosyltransferase YjiC (YdhE family)
MAVRTGVRPQMDRFFSDITKACEGADAILWSFWGVPAYHVAEKMRVPSMGIYLQPFTRTIMFPSVGLPFGISFGPILNMLSHLLAEQMLWQLFRPKWNQWRREELGLGNEGIRGPFVRMVRDKYPIICAFSKHVVSKPWDWHENVEITGFLFLDGESGWTPPQALVDFLKAGPPPVYIGFGSMVTGKEDEVGQIAFEALRISGQRGIILSGWGGIGKSESSAHNVFVVDSVPHAWLFPQMAAVVHHGGAGTLGAGVRAGVPTIIIPHYADQFFWSNRIYKLGVGPRWIPRTKLTAEKLAQAITKAVTDQTMREKARQLGEAVRAEDGIANAVAAIEKFIAKQKA